MYVQVRTKLLVMCRQLLLILVFLDPLNGQLHILDQIEIHFIRFYNWLASSDNLILSLVSRVSIPNLGFRSLV